jgi:hypothetical protein
MPRRKKVQQADQTAAENGDGHSLGHNGLDDDEKRALLLNVLPDIEKLTDEITSRSGSRRNKRKQLMAAGISKMKIDHALALRKAIRLDRLDEFLAERHDRATIERWNNLQVPVDHQEVYNANPDRHFEDGKIAGMAGEIKMVPDYLNQTDGQRWMEGWDAGHPLSQIGRGNGAAPAEEDRGLRPEFLRDGYKESAKANPLDSLAAKPANEGEPS